MNPSYVEAFANRGTAYAIAGSLDSAIADYTSALSLNPNLSGVYDNRARVEEAKSDQVRAANNFQKSKLLTVVHN